MEESQDPDWIHENTEPKELFSASEDESSEHDEYGNSLREPKKLPSPEEKALDEDIHEMVMSPLFEKEAKQMFLKKQQDCLIQRKYFTKIDALDDTINMWIYGRNMYDYPTTNSYVPVRHTILPKPNLSTVSEDIYRFNDVPNGVRDPIRIDQIKQLNPLKPYKTTPGVGTRLSHHIESHPKWIKNRHLSRTKRNFSTMTRQGGFGL